MGKELVYIFDRFEKCRMESLVHSFLDESPLLEAY
jgi:hypothetical protein